MHQAGAVDGAWTGRCRRGRGQAPPAVARRRVARSHRPRCPAARAL